VGTCEVVPFSSLSFSYYVPSFHCCFGIVNFSSALCPVSWPSLESCFKCNLDQTLSEHRSWICYDDYYLLEYDGSSFEVSKYYAWITKWIIEKCLWNRTIEQNGCCLIIGEQSVMNLVISNWHMQSPYLKLHTIICIKWKAEDDLFVSANVIFRCFNSFTGKPSVKSDTKISRLLWKGRTDTCLYIS
jgi:hypothetical protein